MKFLFLLQSNVYHSNIDLAYKMAKEVLNQKHEIYSIFLIQDGVSLANRNLYPIPDIQKKWNDLILNNKIESFCCIGSSVQRGILDESEASLHNKKSTIFDFYSLSSLIKMHQLILQTDRLIQL